MTSNGLVLSKFQLHGLGLRKVLKLPLILTFVGIVALGILLTGYLFNWIL